jgi:tRNA (cytidine/uridine-2'-O-)-methyltransferase
MLNVVLYAPRIPHNTGQIARACHAMDCRLHLIRPLGFRLDAAALRRSAVGYLERIQPVVHRNGEAFWAQVPDPERAWLVSKHGRRPYTGVHYRRGDWLVFGNETEGLPPEWLEAAPGRTLVIPMLNPEVRCLNLATAAAVVLMEAVRQLAPAAASRERS